ncbi:MAG: hypothetical protein IJP60_00840 [Bacilli bacterium]|nr:hypothetical protein [Bacilli bacterium]
MKIEAKFQLGLLKLIKEMPLDEINVVLLCEHVKSNRQTFYYHFRDISDVVESIFLKDKQTFNLKYKNFDGVMKQIIAYMNSKYSFLYAINKSFCSDKEESFFYSYFYSSISNLLGDVKKIPNGNSIMRYLCTLYSSEMMYWLAQKRREKVEMLTRRMKVIWNYFTSQYHQDLRKI